MREFGISRLLLVLTLSVGLAACGGDDGDPDVLGEIEDNNPEVVNPQVGPATEEALEPTVDDPEELLEDIADPDAEVTDREP